MKRSVRLKIVEKWQHRFHFIINTPIYLLCMLKVSRGTIKDASEIIQETLLAHANREIQSSRRLIYLYRKTYISQVKNMNKIHDHLLEYGTFKKLMDPMSKC